MLTQTFAANDNKFVRLWWSLKGRDCVAAAAVVGRPGRTGMLFCCPADSCGVDKVASAQLIRKITGDAIKAGKLYFVQSLQESENHSDIEMVQRGGYEKLAELIYMERPLEDADRDSPDANVIQELTWKSYGQFDDKLLGSIITQTYEGSMDCPGISGLRDLKSVIAGHKASGRFVPQAWSMAYIGNEPVGCILVNDFPGCGDVTYMGVVSAHRGKALSQILLGHAFKLACQRGLRSMTLAVDAANLHAISTYTECGFVEKGRRLVYFFSSTSPQLNAK